MVRSTHESIPHHDELDWVLVFHAYRVDTIDTCQYAVVMLRNALEILLLDASEGLEVFFGHCLDDELLVL